MPSRRALGRTVIRQSLRAQTTRRCFTTSATTLTKSPTTNAAQEDALDIDTLLANPTWSISALLPPKPSDPSSTHPSSISRTQLHHLLRLSALPPPSSSEQESHMLQTLASQLHFVRAIQAVDTSGIEPLRSLRDEREAAVVGLEEMKGALEGEEKVGKFHRRVRRKARDDEGRQDGEGNVLGQAGRKTGRYFVVEGGKKEG